MRDSGREDRLKVRFVTRKWPPAIGGMETYSLRLAEELSSSCRLERIVLPGRPDGRAPQLLTLLRFGIRQAFRTPARRRTDLVHLADLALWPLGALELFFGRTRAIAISVHGSDVSLGFRKGAAACLYRWYLQLGAALLGNVQLIANSSYIADLASEVGFRQVHVVPLGTDIMPMPHQRRKGLLFVGRVTRGKGLRFLVEQVLPRLDPGTRVRVAGSLWEESERTLLNHPAVEYLGALEPARLQVEYARAEITLIPSQVPEGFGLVAIEAAACGSQVIAAQAGGLVDVVQAPWGELVDPRDAEGWARAIRRRCSQAEPAIEQIGQSAMAEIARLHRWRNVAERTFRLYQLALKPCSIRE